MNNRFLCLALALACAAPVFAQEPPGCAAKSSTHTKKQLRTVDTPKRLKGTLPKRKTIDLRRNRTKAPESDERLMPFIASPVYMPQAAGSGGTAITASNGYLYVVVEHKLYKVNEKTLKTVQVSYLSPTRETVEPEPIKRKKTATRKEESKPRRRTHASKTD